MASVSKLKISLLIASHKLMPLAYKGPQFQFSVCLSKTDLLCQPRKEICQFADGIFLLDS